MKKINCYICRDNPGINGTCPNCGREPKLITIQYRYPHDTSTRSIKIREDAGVIREGYSSTYAGLLKHGDKVYILSELATVIKFCYATKEANIIRIHRAGDF